MSKSLIIAEKPSVAADIARALGGFTKHADYFENDEYVISSAVGHLLEIAAPEQFEVKRGKWSFAHLPVIPPHFDIHPIVKSQERLKVLTRLIKRKDVETLINACDAGREGELIFRLIAQHAKAKQPIRRLWLQSMTPAAIREAFQQLRDDRQMIPLADAARCRSEADWLVGINGTRAMTAFNSRDGGFFLTTVGRVQTPTLAIVVEREDKIRRFVPRDYFEVRASFSVEAGEYEGRWFDPQFKKGDDPEHRAERLWERARAEAIVAECAGKRGTVTEETKPSTQMAPALFDLTSLQREANGRFGFSAKTTLSIAQALYEKHKALTYPRTDSRALPEDYIGTVAKTMEALEDLPAMAPFARQVSANGWVKPNKRIFDNTKVSDHFAIIPTLQTPKSLSDAEQRIYDLVVRRFLAVFFPPAEYLLTTRITVVASHNFRTEGRVLVNPGWLAIYGREEGGTGSAGKSDATLVAVRKGEDALARAVEILALTTRPPARYNEGTLLSAMEGAGKLVEDDELREAMAEKGLGTPATRASIIEGLIAENYLIRDGKELIPTPKAFQLLTLLRGLGVQELTMPELTGEWEYKLAQMERGRLDRATFMDEIAEVTRRIVERAKNYQSDTVPGDYATLRTPCPKCGAVVQENYKRFACTKCDFSISKHPGGRTFQLDEVEQLLTERTLGPLQGFRSRLGRPFAAILKITPEFKLEFDFGQSRADEAGNEEPVDFSGQAVLGPCPKCGAGVYEHGLSYVCEKSVGPERSCDFRSGKIILQQEIAAEQMQRLLNEGRTDLLTGFVSSRTRRKFKAFLVRGTDGKIGFEFEPRPQKPEAKAAPAARGASKAGASGAGAADETSEDAAGKAAGKTSAAKASAGKVSAASAAGTAARGAAPGARKPAAKKPAAKKPTARKPATKSPAAKKAAAAKPAAKKAATKKAAAG
ncbi:MAG TPA: DNA topoisomerase III [Quisquiliibacterium sp.]|nr:DNA topoisomerase III [Quisquiliibacterium sp.]